MFIFMFLLTVLAVAGIVASIRSTRRDGYRRQPTSVTHDYDALIRWR
ncbi:hypothetical protein [Cryobacterium sp. PH31-O1]|nr:hypothetical protein [Cryobacterium sp. PH31-O1]MDJ0337557.1 hypothetical protein [Cryobacterium sp. PH31-O1]